MIKNVMPASKLRHIRNFEMMTGKSYSLIKMIIEDNKNDIIDEIMKYPKFRIYISSESRPKINECIDYYQLDFQRVDRNMGDFYFEQEKLDKNLSNEQIKNILSYLLDYIDEFMISRILRQLNLITIESDND